MEKRLFYDQVFYHERVKIRSKSGVWKERTSGLEYVHIEYSCLCRDLRYNFYRPQMKLWKGNVFTSVCQEFCPRGEGVHPPAGHPSPRQTPPPHRRLLQRTVRILLECILVWSEFLTLPLADPGLPGGANVLFVIILRKLHKNLKIGLKRSAPF